MSAPASRALAAFSLALAGAVPACLGGATGALPERPLWAHRPSGSLALLWSRPLLAESRRRGEPYEQGQPALDPASRRLFVGSSDRGLYALRAVNGEVLWRFETLGAVQSEPLYDGQEDVVYFGSHDGALYKVRAADGGLLWRFSTNAEVTSRPVLAEGRLLAVNANDTVVALDPRDGRLLWAQRRTPSGGMQIAGHAGLAVARGKVHAAFSDGNVAAFQLADGRERWPPVDLSAEAEDQVVGDVPQFLDADATPVIDEVEGGPAVFVGAYVGGVHALDAETGTNLWTNSRVAGVTRLVAWRQEAHVDRAGRAQPSRRLLLAATGTTGLWALDPETGTEVWRTPFAVGGVGAPVPMQGALLVAASGLGLFLVSPLDGGLIDGLHFADGITATPAVHGRRAFVTTAGGRLLALYLEPPR